MYYFTGIRAASAKALLLCAIWLMALGCGSEVIDVQSVEEIKLRGDEVLEKDIRITAQVEFVSDGAGRGFLLKDPGKTSDAGVLVRCSPEDLTKVRDSLEKLKADQVAIVGRVYKTAPPENQIKIEFKYLAGSKLKWLILVSILVVVLAIIIVVVLLLKRPSRSLDELIYVVEGEETIRRYAQLNLYEAGQLNKVWFLAYDQNLTEPRITENDIVLGTEGLLIGRENPLLGLCSITYSRRVARLRFQTRTREFEVVNEHSRKPLRLFADRDENRPREVAPGQGATLSDRDWIQVDHNIRIQFLRREEESGAAGGTVSL